MAGARQTSSRFFLYYIPVSYAQTLISITGKCISGVAWFSDNVNLVLDESTSIQWSKSTGRVIFSKCCKNFGKFWYLPRFLRHLLQDPLQDSRSFIRDPPLLMGTFESRMQKVAGSNPNRSWEGCDEDSIGSMQFLPVHSAEWSGNRDWGSNEEDP